MASKSGEEEKGDRKSAKGRRRKLLAKSEEDKRRSRMIYLSVYRKEEIFNEIYEENKYLVCRRK